MILFLQTVIQKESTTWNISRKRNFKQKIWKHTLFPRYWGHEANSEIYLSPRKFWIFEKRLGCKVLGQQRLLWFLIWSKLRMEDSYLMILEDIVDLLESLTTYDCTRNSSAVTCVSQFMAPLTFSYWEAVDHSLIELFSWSWSPL